MRYFLVSILVFSSFAFEKIDEIRGKLYTQLSLDALVYYNSKLTDFVADHNIKNPTLKFKKQNDHYILKDRNLVLKFGYKDLLMKRIYVNKKKFNLIKDENDLLTKERFLDLIKDQKIYSYYQILVDNVFATDDNTFNRILNAALHISNYSDGWSFGSDDAKVVYDQIKEQKRSCEQMRELGVSTAPSVSDVGDFISKVLYSPFHSEYEDFIENVKEEIIDNHSTLKKQATKEAVNKMVGCQALSYLVGKGEKDLAGNAYSSEVRVLGNVSQYVVSIGGSNTSPIQREMLSFCYEVEQLAECLTDMYSLGEAVADSFKRTVKDVEMNKSLDNYIKKYQSLSK